MMDSKTKKKGYILFSLVGILAALFTMACNELAEKGNIIWNFQWILRWSICGIVLGGILGGTLFFLCLLWKDKVVGNRKLPACLTSECKVGKTFGLSFAVLVGCWFPAWLAYYPGICSYDIPAQMVQILTGQYNTHHPLAHTLLLETFYELGQKLGNENLGIGLGTLLQLLFLAGSLAGMVAILAKRRCKRWQVIITTFYFAVLPINAYMSITTTKDVVFSIFVIWFFVVLYGYLGEQVKQSVLRRVLYVFVLVGVVLFRNNGRYALAVLFGSLTIVVLVKLMKRIKLQKWKVLFVDTFIGLCLGCLLAVGIEKCLNAQPADKREMLSIPIQQLARTMVYHGGYEVLPEDDNSMDMQDKVLLQEFFLYECYKEYRPEISDPVKRYTNTYVVRYRTAEFLKTYLNLFTKYPGDFVNATIAINAGWVSPMDNTHATINQYEVKAGLGYIQTNWSQELEGTNLYRDSKFPWLLQKMEQFASDNTYLNIPIVRFFVAPGMYLWCYMLMAIWLYLHKKYKDLLPFAWIAGYYGTLILGPAVQLRYLYPLMIALPFFWMYVRKNTSENAV